MTAVSVKITGCSNIGMAKIEEVSAFLPILPGMSHLRGANNPEDKLALLTGSDFGGIVSQHIPEVLSENGQSRGP